MKKQKQDTDASSQTSSSVSLRSDTKKRSGVKPKGYPALLGRYRDLSTLRHDYPLVFVNGNSDGCFRPLSAEINRVLRQIAPQGKPGETLRKNVLALEARIRDRVLKGENQILSELWGHARTSLLSDWQLDKDREDSVKRDLEAAQRTLIDDGKVVGCSVSTPVQTLKHVWITCRSRRNRVVLEELKALELRLSGLLQADFLKSNEGHSSDVLRDSMGAGREDVFDYDVMATLLQSSLAAEPLPESRRDRIQRALEALRSQTFYVSDEPSSHAFLFDSCTEALEHLRRQLPRMAEFVKAVRIAHLEIDNRYSEEKHDPLFDAFDERSLRPEDIRRFPAWLIRQKAGQWSDTDKAALFEILDTGCPVKVMVCVDDILEESTINSERLASGGWTRRLANVALGLNEVYVVQAGASQLGQIERDIIEGFEYPGPALFSIFTGAALQSSDIPNYLVTASAVESRVFPTFVFNPSGGKDWASRFTIKNNPQMQVTWTKHNFLYEDEELQAVKEETAFTAVDFLALDPRLAHDFTLIPRSQWTDNMEPISRFLDVDEGQAKGKVPYILMMDERHTVYRAVVTERLVRLARQYADHWRSLQELGGINNSHAQQLLQREKAAWEEAKARDIEEIRQQADVEVTVQAEPVTEKTETVVPPDEPIVEQIQTDEPYIETARCNSCSECVNKNRLMFAYNENKQAYIADAGAGSFRDLVEAAEKCQMAIIHPGKPKNPDEPGLEELIERAKPFN